MRNVLKTSLALLTALPVALSAIASHASTAANTAIVNNALLTYNGGLTAQSSVTVIVSLVPAQPNVTITSASGNYTGVNTMALSNTVTVTSTANGPALYTVTPAVASSTNTSVPSVTGGASITLGATVTAGPGTATSITVPAPVGGATTANSPVNNIGVGTIIVFTINGHTYTQAVTSTAYNLANNTFTISWATTSPLASGDVAGNVIGLQVGERQQIILTAAPGTVTVLGTVITSTITANVTATNFPAGSATTSPGDSWSSTPPTISFQKYSRNVTNPFIGTGTPHTNAAIEGNTGAGSLPYYTGGVYGKTGDVIEYVVEASNSSASLLDLTTCAISDTIPTSYVTDLLSPYNGSKQVFYIDNTGAAPVTYDLTAGAVGANLASYVTPALNVYVGVGANNTTPGTIPIGHSVTIAYQVKIK